MPGPHVDGKPTAVVKFVYDTPHASHCKEVAGMMHKLNKLHIGRWLIEFLQSEETSCCYAFDGAEAAQMERLGQALSRRVDGKLEVSACMS